MTGDPRWLRLARAELGQSEIGGRSRHNDVIVGYWRRGGIARRDGTSWEPGNDETPWCAAFIGAILSEAGFSPTHSALARSYENWGEAVQTGEGAHRWASIPLGAVVVLNRPGAGPTRGHVGFATGAATQHVELIGGNQNDSVSQAWFPKARIVAVRWPKGEPASEYLMWGKAPARAGRTRTG